MLKQAISRVLSPEAVTRYGVMTIHLASPLPTRSSDLPGDLDGPPSNVPLFGLAPGGVYRAPAVTGRPGELLPHPFTLTRVDAKHRRGRFPFCGTFLPVAGTGDYPAPCPSEPGLSSPPPRRRSSGHLSCFNIFVRLVSPKAYSFSPTFWNFSLSAQ